MSSQSLKSGFTTGAAAAAATKAAFLCLVDPTINAKYIQCAKYTENIKQRVIEKVQIRCLNGEYIFIDIESIKKLSNTCVEAIVIKDAGDDPDVTHKAEIGSKVTIRYCNDENHHDAQVQSDSTIGGSYAEGSYAEYDSTKMAKDNSTYKGHVWVSINIRGGEGVGIVTKPGLEVLPGNPAINLGPKTMIYEAINSVLEFINREQSHYKYKPPLVSKMVVDVEIFVPKGRELAEKTLNARLGIIGGISILGTTGIVKPMSHDAYIATIKSGISVAKAMGCNTVVFTTGRRSEKAAISLFPQLMEEAFIQTGDFFKASIEAASLHNIKQVIIVVFFGKAVKMAMGFPHTHAAKSELTMKRLVSWAEDITTENSSDSADIYNSTLAKNSLAQKIANSNTARHAFTYIYPEYPELIDYVGSKIVQSAAKFAKAIGNSSLKIRSIILDFDGNKIFDSAQDSTILKSNMEIL